MNRIEVEHFKITGRKIQISQSVQDSTKGFSRPEFIMTENTIQVVGEEESSVMRPTVDLASYITELNGPLVRY